MKRPKLKRCPVCNSRPHYMSIDNMSGYVLCNICQLNTKRYDDFIESWQEQAAEEWNNKIEAAELEEK